MFICNECLREHYDNPDAGLFPRSVGPCEICSRKRICVDIQSSWLKLKPIRQAEPKPEMRSREEIQRAVDRLKQALREADNPDQLILGTTATKGLIKALDWALGSDEQNGFGELLKELEQQGPLRKPS